MDNNSLDNSSYDAVREQLKNRGAKTAEIPFNHNKINGVVVAANMDQKIYDALNEFQARPDDVFIVTYPKSGTFWLANIVQNIAKPKGSGNEHILGGTTPIFDFATPEQLAEYPSPRYMLTHFSHTMFPLNQEYQLKYIYLARNPKDVAVSYFHFLSGLKGIEFEVTWDEFIELFMKGNVFYGSQFDHILEWWNHKNDYNMLFMTFEQLKADLKTHVKIIAEFIGFTLSDQEISKISEECTFKSMKAKPETTLDQYGDLLFKEGTSHMRKGTVGDWKFHFTEQQLEAFDKLYQSRLGNTDINFEFAVNE